MVKFYVGVSGFSYASWKGTFYPDDAKSEDFLPLYANRLESVEVNSSFYAPPRGAVVKGWGARTGEKFRFSFKAPRLVTHIQKLGGSSAESAGKFFETLGLLGPRRGPVLFQLPPFMKSDQGLLSRFLQATSGIKPKVFEFRNESWLNEPTYRLLESEGAGFCVAETEDMEPVFRVTGDSAYFRLRKDSYDTKSIGRWERKVRETAVGASDCYVYLRHDETGANALLAEKLQSSLDSK